MSRWHLGGGFRSCSFLLILFIEFLLIPTDNSFCVEDTCQARGWFGGSTPKMAYIENRLTSRWLFFFFSVQRTKLMAFCGAGSILPPLLRPPVLIAVQVVSFVGTPRPFWAVSKTVQEQMDRKMGEMVPKVEAQRDGECEHHTDMLYGRCRQDANMHQESNEMICSSIFDCFES